MPNSPAYVLPRFAVVQRPVAFLQLATSYFPLAVHGLC